MDVGSGAGHATARIVRPLRGRSLDCERRAAYLEDGEWTVVDYKTDRPEIGSPRLAGYEAQVSLYADILERATGQRAKALLLFV